MNDPVQLTDRQKELLLPVETKKKYGYEVGELSHGTPRKVVHKCDVCGEPKETPFREFVLGQKWAHFKCKVSKMRQTNLKKFGTEYASQSPEIQRKIKQTFLKNYGVENSQLCPGVRKKKEETNLKRYGVRHPLQSSEIRQKTTQTLINNYGVDLPGKSIEIQNRIRQTCVERYGVERPLQSPEIREKWNQTNLTKYGAEYPAQVSFIREKMKQSMLEEYGVEYYAQLPEERDKLINWCREHPEKMFTPKSELELLRWIQEYYPDARKHKSNKGEIDICISEIGIGIEHNGLFYHQEDVVGRNYHLNKTKYFESQNVRIIHIFEHEWKYRQKQVKSFLLSIMGKNDNKISARKCSLTWSSSKQDIQEVCQFLEDYHIQGAPNNVEYVIKASYNNELLAVAAFGKHHRNNRDWVLTRFCTKTNYTIQGVLSRISRLASRQLKEDIISWADYRLSKGSEYKEAGWVFEQLLPPDYFYHRALKVIDKEEYPTHINQADYRKVYDCGKKQYRYSWSK